MQEYVCTLVGKKAKFKGKKKAWWRTQTLYWRGVAIKRNSDDYQELLDRAFDALAKNEKFQNALLATGDARLSHRMGKSKESETVLTQTEFCSRLVRLRSELRK